MQLTTDLGLFRPITGPRTWGSGSSRTPNIAEAALHSFAPPLLEDAAVSGRHLYTNPDSS